MPEIRTIDLQNDVPRGRAITFLRAEVPSEHKIPFALIRYSLNGKEEEYGLRLDLDKRVFLDSFDDYEKNEELARAISFIIKVLLFEQRSDSQNGIIRQQIPSGVQLNLFNS